MADSNDKILFSVIIDKAAAGIELSRLIKETEQLKAANQNLITTNNELKKAGKALSDEYINNEKAIIANKQAMGDNNKSVSALTAAVTNHDKTVAIATRQIQSQAKSINDLREENKRLLAVANAVDLTDKKAMETRAKALKQIDDNNKKIKENSDSLTKQKINIGNYKSALDGVSPALDKLAPGLSGMTSGIWATTKASLAFIATPFGAILTAIAVTMKIVYNLFSSFAPVVEFVENAIAGLSAAWDTLKQGFLGWITGEKSFSESFSNIGKKMNEAARAAIELKEAQRALEVQMLATEISSLKLEGQIKNCLIAAKDLTKSEKERADALKKADQLALQKYNNEKNNAQEQLRQKQEALRIALDLSDKELEKLKEQGATYEDVINKKKSVGDKEKELFKELHEAQKNLITIENEYSAFYEKNVDKRSALVEKQKENAQKAADARKKAAEDKKKELEKAAQDEAKAALDISDAKIKAKELEIKAIHAANVEAIEKRQALQLEEQKLELAKEEEDYKQKIGNKNLSTAQIEAIEWRHTNILTEINQKYLDFAKSNAEEIKAIETKAATDIYEAKVKAKQEEITAIEILSQEDIDKRTQFQAELTQMEIDRETEDYLNKVTVAADNKAQLEAIELQHNSNLAGIYQKDTDNYKKNKEAKKKLDDASLKDQVTLLNAYGNALGSFSALAQAFGNKGKALAIAEASINTFKNAVAIGGQTAFGTGPAAPFIYAATLASIIASGLAQVAKISGVQFRQGGKAWGTGHMYTLGGRRHSEGGTKFWGTDGTHFEAEEGENVFILKREASREINWLSNINQKHGGLPLGPTPKYFRQGGNATPMPHLFANGGSPDVINTANRFRDQQEQTAALINAINNIPRTAVVIEDVEAVSARRATINERSQI